LSPPRKRKAGSADSRLPAARSPPRAGCCRRPRRQQLGKTCPLFLSPGSPCPSKGQTNYYFPPGGVRPEVREGGKLERTPPGQAPPGGDGNKGQTNYPPANERKRDRQIIAPVQKEGRIRRFKTSSSQEPATGGMLPQAKKAATGKNLPPLYFCPRGIPLFRRRDRQIIISPLGEAGSKGGKVGAHSS
jgi:hypothetical protein